MGEPLDTGVPIAVKEGQVVLESATLLPLGIYPLPPTVGIGTRTGWGYSRD